MTIYSFNHPVWQWPKATLPLCVLYKWQTAESLSLLSTNLCWLRIYSPVGLFLLILHFCQTRDNLVTLQFPSFFKSIITISFKKLMVHSHHYLHVTPFSLIVLSDVFSILLCCFQKVTWSCVWASANVKTFHLGACPSVSTPCIFFHVLNIFLFVNQSYMMDFVRCSIN